MWPASWKHRYRTCKFKKMTLPRGCRLANISIINQLHSSSLQHVCLSLFLKSHNLDWHSKANILVLTRKTKEKYLKNSWLKLRSEVATTGLFIRASEGVERNMRSATSNAWLIGDVMPKCGGVICNVCYYCKTSHTVTLVPLAVLPEASSHTVQPNSPPLPSVTKRICLYHSRVTKGTNSVWSGSQRKICEWGETSYVTRERVPMKTAI